MMSREELQQLLIKHEGWRNRVYLDTKGLPTVGVGFNMKAAGAKALMGSLGIDYINVLSGASLLTNVQVQELFDKSTNYAIATANVLVPSFPNLPDPVQMAITDMAFNLGYTGLEGFENFIAALSKTPPDFSTAVTEMRNSLWARQLPVRSSDDINLVLSVIQSAGPQPAQGA
jgi:lysozyme